MLFSSPIFLFLFLPFALVVDRLPGARARNAALFATSLAFYAWGEPAIVGVMAASILVNHVLARTIERHREQGRSGHVPLAIAVVSNLAVLGWFKYANFIAANLAFVAAHVGWSLPELGPIRLPIGVSFFTFQAISYVVDVHRGVVRTPRDPLAFGLYLALFPQLIAGPIVRYREVEADIRRRVVRLAPFAAGLRRFVRGLAKKVLIADGLGGAVDAIFALQPEQLSPAVAWFGAAAYALQIYFDFSGYSDMAIGLGRMLGLKFPENFASPYRSRSITEFWRRWHMTLSRWFRDYVYIPLGGNRAGRLRTLGHLALVFLLCGLWHGARWTFVIWGLYHGVFLILERMLGEDRVRRMPRAAGHLYALLVVTVGWVFFRADTLAHAVDYLGSMSGLVPATSPGYGLDLFAQGRALASFALGLLCCLPLPERARPASAVGELAERGALPSALGAGSALAHLALLVLCLVFVVAGTQNSFIYFRF